MKSEVGWKRRIRFTILFVHALSKRIEIDFVLRRGRFVDLRTSLAFRSQDSSRPGTNTVSEVWAAIIGASRVYSGCSPCLVQALTGVILLRKRANVPAQVVLGVTEVPYSGHAWIEVNASVLGEQEDIKRFREIDRF